MNREHTVWEWVLQGTGDRIINGAAASTIAPGCRRNGRRRTALDSLVVGDVQIHGLEPDNQCFEAAQDEKQAG